MAVTNALTIEFLNKIAGQQWKLVVENTITGGQWKPCVCSPTLMVSGLESMNGTTTIPLPPSILYLLLFGLVYTKPCACLWQPHAVGWIVLNQGILGEEGNVLFNNTLNTFYLCYMALDIW